MRPLPPVPWVTQPHGEATCRMVAAVNARLSLGLDPLVTPDTPEWLALRRLAGAMHGPVSRHDALLGALGLTCEALDGEAGARALLTQGVPIELALWVDGLGLHAVLAVQLVGDEALVVNPGGPDGPPFERDAWAPLWGQAREAWALWLA